MAEGDASVVLSEIGSSGGAGSKQIFLQTKLRDKGNEGFELVVFDGSTVWEGTITESYLDNQSEALKMDFNTYVKETTAALTREADTNTTFEATFQTLSPTTARLVWKKIPTKSIKYNLGSLDLKKSGRFAETLCSVLSQCIGRSQALQAQINSLETDNQRLSQDRQNALKRLEKCVSAKDQLEKDLYSKFVLVLNSKKERIRELENGHVSQSINDDDDLAASPKQSTSMVNRTEDRQAPSSHRNNTGSPSDDGQSSLAFDVDTEDETTPAKKVCTQTVTSVAVSDSSLNLGKDDDDGGGHRMPVARRARRKPTTKKETPAKPVLPRVSSVSSNDKGDLQSPRRSSLRKSGSAKSNKSSDNLEPDDLMDDL